MIRRQFLINFHLLSKHFLCPNQMIKTSRWSMFLVTNQMAEMSMVFCSVNTQYLMSKYNWLSVHCAPMQVSKYCFYWLPARGSYQVILKRLWAGQIICYNRLPNYFWKKSIFLPYVSLSQTDSQVFASSCKWRPNGLCLVLQPRATVIKDQKVNQRGTQEFPSLPALALLSR